MTELCSTAYYARKSDGSPARALVGAASTEQNGLAPHPAARQGASRARNCAATGVFSFDGSTAVFFLAPQKENGGGKPAGVARHPRLVNRPTTVGCGHPALRKSVPTIPQSPYGRQLPLHKGAFGDGLQRWQCAATGRCGHRPLRVRWLGPSGAELRLFSLHTRVFSSGREKETRGQGLALPPRVLMGIAYFWQVLRKR